MGGLVNLQEALQNYMIHDARVLRPDEEYVADIQRMFPVEQLLRVTRLPSGDAPKEIRGAWIGLDLPVRAKVEHHVPVLGVDALLALRQSNRSEAYEWWTRFYETDNAVHMNLGVGLPLYLNPWATRRSLVARISFLGFDRSDGNLAKAEKGLS